MTTVAFDVDGTLIGFGDTPNYDVINFFHQFQNFGCEMYIWSGGGIEYAMHWMNKLGLAANVIEKGSIIVDIAVDDQYITLGKVNIGI